jgi:hypothetical protein
MAAAAVFDFDGIERGEARRFAKPSDELGLVSDGRGSSEKEDKNRLGYVLGKMPIADLSPGGGIDQARMAARELADYFSRASARILFKQARNVRNLGHAI